MKALSAKASRKKLGARIRKVREDQELSQKQLAFEANISRYLVIQIEQGETNLTHDTLHAIAVALDVEIKGLFDFEY